MYQALYRKWRPQTFSDVVGQEHITSVLQYQLSSDKLSHAYIFCGSRGTGKTTCAKLLAKAANCTNLQSGNPCNECESCRMINAGTSTDVVELDAASNNKVDDIRVICDEVVYPPASMKKRVYIVDEVHMLTMQAFNALLKTLEEPPKHAMFILATTELHKVPATIMSRCQRFDFSRIKKEKIVDRIMHICSEEGINLERDAATVIANLSDGAMRDALSLLESCSSKGGFITAEYVINLLGLSNREILIELLYSCSKQNTVRAISLVNELYEKNGDITSCFYELLSICRDTLIIKNVASPTRFLNCSEAEITKLSEIAESVSNETLSYYIEELKRFISSPEIFGVNKKVTAEITVIKMTSPSSINTVDALLDRISRLEKSINDGAVIPKKNEKKEPVTKKEIISQKEVKKTPDAVSSSNKDVFEFTNDFVRRYGEKQPMNKYFMDSVKIKQNGNELTIIADSLAVSMLNTPSSIQLALEIAKDLNPDIESVNIVQGEVNSDKTSSDLDNL